MFSFLVFLKDHYQNPFVHIGFKDPATSLMENIIDLHHFIFFFILVISGVVLWLLVQIIDNYIYLSNFDVYSLKNSIYINNKKKTNRRLMSGLFLAGLAQTRAKAKDLDKFIKFSLVISATKKRFFKEDSMLEACWTFLPAVILIIISLPSFYMLYLSEESINTFLTVKAVGHQWYWTYDYVDLFPCWYNYKTDASDIDDILLKVICYLLNF